MTKTISSHKINLEFLWHFDLTYNNEQYFHISGKSFISVVFRKFLESVYWFGFPKPKISSSTLLKSFFFIKQTIISFLCEIYQKLDILNAYLWIKYSMTKEKQRFLGKTCNSFLNQDAPPILRCNRWPLKTN